MYCKKCGIELREHAAFCDNCGAPLDNENANAYKYDPYQRVEPDQIINVAPHHKRSAFVLTSGILTTIATVIELFILIPIIYALADVKFFETSLIFIAAAIFTVIAQGVSGMHGIMFWRRPERMGSCLCWGFIWLACMILDILVPIVTMLAGPMSISAASSLHYFLNSYGSLIFLIFLIGHISLILYIISVAAFKRRA